MKKDNAEIIIDFEKGFEQLRSRILVVVYGYLVFIFIGVVSYVVAPGQFTYKTLVHGSCVSEELCDRPKINFDLTRGAFGAFLHYQFAQYIQESDPSLVVIDPVNCSDFQRCVDIFPKPLSFGIVEIKVISNFEMDKKMIDSSLRGGIDEWRSHFINYQGFKARQIGREPEFRRDIVLTEILNVEEIPAQRVGREIAQSVLEELEKLSIKLDDVVLYRFDSRSLVSTLMVTTISYFFCVIFFGVFNSISRGQLET